MQYLPNTRLRQLCYVAELFIIISTKKKYPYWGWGWGGRCPRDIQHPEVKLLSFSFQGLVESQPITVATRSRAWTAFPRTNTGIVGSNPIRGMDVCVRLICVCVVLCVDSDLATGWSPVQGVLPTVYRLRNWKSGQGPTKSCKAIDG
jgi:hypothetical protein